MSKLNFTSIQLDALKEVGNIGIGNAATALAQLINKKVAMVVPAVNIVELASMVEGEYAQDVVIGSVVQALGDAPGNILFVIKKEVAQEFIEILTGMREEEFTEMGFSVVQELGNIISCSYMKAMSEFAELNLVASTPKVLYDKLGTLLENTIRDAGQPENQVLDIETRFLQDDKDISGHFYFIPHPGSLEKILKTLGMN